VQFCVGRATASGKPSCAETCTLATAILGNTSRGQKSKAQEVAAAWPRPLRLNIS
jgi:Fe-S-cluster-containing dehydrogenase component